MSLMSTWVKRLTQTALVVMVSVLLSPMMVTESLAQTLQGVPAGCDPQTSCIYLIVAPVGYTVVQPADPTACPPDGTLPAGGPGNCVSSAGDFSVLSCADPLGDTQYFCFDATDGSGNPVTINYNAPEMSDFMAVLFLVIAGGIIYHLRRREFTKV